jgi:hypothetical protein
LSVSTPAPGREAAASGMIVSPGPIAPIVDDEPTGIVGDARRASVPSEYDADSGVNAVLVTVTKGAASIVDALLVTVASGIDGKSEDELVVGTDAGVDAVLVTVAADADRLSDAVLAAVADRADAGVDAALVIVVEDAVRAIFGATVVGSTGNAPTALLTLLWAVGDMAAVIASPSGLGASGGISWGTLALAGVGWGRAGAAETRWKLRLAVMLTLAVCAAGALTAAAVAVTGRAAGAAVALLAGEFVVGVGVIRLAS